MKALSLNVKRYGKCRSFCGKTNGQTDRPKTICPRYNDAGGIKKQPCTSSIYFVRPLTIGLLRVMFKPWTIILGIVNEGCAMHSTGGRILV